MSQRTIDALPRLSARLVLIAYGIALALAGSLSLAWATVAYPPPSIGAVAAGWGVALLNAFAGFFIKWMGLGGDLTRFLFWAICVNMLRGAFLVVIIVCVHRQEMATFAPFHTSVWIGYFSCMVAEIAILQIASTGGD